jgi:signal transduction histidine kinase
MNFVALQEIYLQEKRVFTEEMNSTVTSMILNWESITYVKGSGFSSSINNNGKVTIRRDTTYIFQVPQNEWSAEVHQMRSIYDVCDSTKWTTAKLDSIFTEEMRLRYDLQVPHVFTLKDSEGNVVNQCTVGNILSLFRIKTDEIPLGFIRPRVFYSEFSIPLLIMWERSWYRLLSVFFLFFILVICIEILYKNLRSERKASEHQEQFVSALVHNLRRPAITLKSVLSAPSFSHEEKISNTQVIISDLIKTVDRLLVLSVHETGLQIHREDCVLKPLIERHVKKITANPGGNKEIEVRVHVIPEHLTVWVDPFHFGGVLDNLIDNSVKYSGDKVEIVITGNELRKKWTLSVKDNGIGISPKALPRIFDHYHRESPNRTWVSQKGYGIGLNYVRTVVRAHKGKIRVVSDGEHGSEFIIEMSKK